MYVRFNGISATVWEIQPSGAITQQKERCITTTEEVGGDGVGAGGRGGKLLKEG